MPRVAPYRGRSGDHVSMPGLLAIAIFAWCGVALLSVRTLDLRHRAHKQIPHLQDFLETHCENRIQLRLSLTPPVVIRLDLYAKEAPDAARFVNETISSSTQPCADCSLYRAEPVPEYWGSPAYPDRWFDGGRWGPPYALLQGKFPNGNEWNINAAPEDHRPIIQRGMVAWAGGKGGPHFFIALADHPEWKHDHTVWAKVVEEDMSKVLLLLQRPLKEITPKQPPRLSYFVTPIEFSVSR
jgi:hypothetical protein